MFSAILAVTSSRSWLGEERTGLAVEHPDQHCYTGWGSRWNYKYFKEQCIAHQLSELSTEYRDVSGTWQTASQCWPCACLWHKAERVVGLGKIGQRQDHGSPCCSKQARSQTRARVLGQGLKTCWSSLWSWRSRKESPICEFQQVDSR